MVSAMDALVGGEVQGTFSRSPGFGLALLGAQTDQASGQDLADLGETLGGGHQVGVEGVRSSHWSASVSVSS